MCGRIVLYRTPREVAQAFDVPSVEPDLFEPSWNVRPTAAIPIVRCADGIRSLALARWWLITPWSTDGKPDSKYPTFNAKAETVDEKASFKKPLVKRRCLVPADGFYEWKKGTKKDDKQPHFIRRKDGDLMAFAGLWERWHRGDEAVESCTVITGPPDDFMAGLHNRMPLEVPSELWSYWLDPANTDPAELKAMLASITSTSWTAHEVSREGLARPGGGGPELLGAA